MPSDPENGVIFLDQEEERIKNEIAHEAVRAQSTNSLIPDVAEQVVHYIQDEKIPRETEASAFFDAKRRFAQGKGQQPVASEQKKDS